MEYNWTADTHLMREKNKRLREINENIKQEVINISNMVKRVNEGWEGKNSDMYVETFNNYKPAMDKKTEVIDVVIEKINEAINIIEDKQINEAIAVRKVGKS